LISLLNTRAHAARILVLVTTENLNLDEALDQYFQIENSFSKQDKGFIQLLCYGTMRFYHRLEFISTLLLKKSFKAKEVDLKNLIYLGLYQLFYLETPSYAAISATVEAAKQLNKAWAAALINAVLRNAVRQKEKLLNQVSKHEVAMTSHPEWLLQKIQKAYPENWLSIIEANNQQAPLTLRVNTQKITVSEYLAALKEKGIVAREGKLSAVAIYLEAPLAIEQLPGFAEGEVSVQDEAAQLAAGLLDLKAHQRVLDLCAAPGSKTMHILEQCPSVELTSLEVSAKRALKISENLNRIGAAAKIIVEDLRSFSKNWEGELFDRILLDSPCSAVGVIRRHPDIKFLRTEKEVQQIVKLQAELLQAAWRLLKPQGILVYATCSILPEENQEQIQAFLKREPAASLDLEKIVLPELQGHDGFYYARLSRLCEEHSDEAIQAKPPRQPAAATPP